MNQTTIRKAFSCSGIGLHTGSHVMAKISPARAGTGIVFEVSTPAGIKRISPRPERVIATGLATTLGCEEASVSTVEHLLATIRGLNIDNLLIRIDGGEVPILDGSAAEWLRLFDRAGLKTQRAVRHVLRITRPIELREGNKWIKATPHNGFAVDCTIDFPHPVIGRQEMRLEINPLTFQNIASARTFGFLREVEYLRSHGLAKGGSLDNAIVIGDAGVINPEGLRFENEFVRHKLLDFVGDMAMLPLPLQGSFETCRSGHELNNHFVRKLVSEHALEEIELAEHQHLSQTFGCNTTWIAA